MKKILSMVLTAGFLLAGNQIALADPIVGNWLNESKETVAVNKCGGSFCFKVKTGKHAGKTVGKLTPSGGSYKGSLTDPNDGKTYTGSAKVSGSKMRLKGCALKVFCKTQNWKKL